VRYLSLITRSPGGGNVEIALLKLLYGAAVRYCFCREVLYGWRESESGVDGATLGTYNR